jgi:hypothetical protein
MRRVSRFLIWPLLTMAACTATLPGTPLGLDTAGFELVHSCAGVGLPPFRIETDGDHLAYVDVGTNASLRLVWPSGFAARLVDGKGILYAGSGAIVAHEDDVIEDAGACPRSDGSILIESIATRTLM